MAYKPTLAQREEIREKLRALGPGEQCMFALPEDKEDARTLHQWIGGRANGLHGGKRFWTSRVRDQKTKKYLPLLAVTRKRNDE